MKPNPAPKLRIEPATAAVTTGGTQSFRAVGGTPPYSFDFAPGGEKTGGSIGPGASPGTGAYEAGPKPGKDRVRVTDARGNTADASVDVATPLELSATDPKVVVRTATTLQATGGKPPYTFAFSSTGNVSGGSVDPNTGDYTAGTLTGTDTIEVTDNVDRTATATVEVRPALQIEVPADAMHKVMLGSPVGGGSLANPSAALEITVATGIEVPLKVVGGVPDFDLALGYEIPGCSASAPEQGERTFTYTAGLTVGANRRTTDTVLIWDSQSSPNEATVSVTVTENFEDLAALASTPGFKLPYFTLRTLHPFLGFSLHDGVIFPPPPAVPKDGLPCIDFSILHTIGLQSLPSRGHAGERGPVVGPAGAYFVGRGSDAGFVVPHVSIPINNVLLPLVILLGESKSLFGASSVRMPCWSLLGGSDECDAACACPIPYVPLGLNLCCSDPLPLPTDVVIAPSTVLAGVGLLDFAGALIDVILEYGVALVMWGVSSGLNLGVDEAAKGVKKLGKKGAKEVGEKVGKEVVEEVVEKGGKEVAEEVVEKGGKEVAEKAAKDDTALKKVGRKFWADKTEKARILKNSADYKSLIRKGMTPDEALQKLMKPGAWKQTGDILKPYGMAILTEFIEQPLDWGATRVGKIDDYVRGLYARDDDWWEWGELWAIESAIVQTIWKQPPGGSGWWGDW